MNTHRHSTRGTWALLPWILAPRLTWLVAGSDESQSLPLGAPCSSPACTSSAPSSQSTLPTEWWSQKIKMHRSHSPLLTKTLLQWPLLAHRKSPDSLKWPQGPMGSTPWLMGSFQLFIQCPDPSALSHPWAFAYAIPSARNTHSSPHPPWIFRCLLLLGVLRDPPGWVHHELCRFPHPRSTHCGSSLSVDGLSPSWPGSPEKAGSRVSWSPLCSQHSPA